MVTVYIKNMVCPRCITAVEEIFEELQFEVQGVKLGTATISGKGSFPHLSKRLAAHGLRC